MKIIVNILKNNKLEQEIFECKNVNSYYSGYYKIGRGESLLSVSKKFSLPPQIIKDSNKGLKFCYGVTAFIPETTKRRYIIEPTDKIEGLCKKLNLTSNEIQYQLGGKFIIFGQTILW